MIVKVDSINAVARTTAGSGARKDAAPASRRAGAAFALGGVLSAVWGAWLLAAFLAAQAANPAATGGQAIRRAFLGMGSAAEVLWVGASLCWAAGMTFLAVSGGGGVRRLHLALPLLAAFCYAYAGLRNSALLPDVWLLRVPPTAAGTICWSLGMCAVGVSALRSDVRGSARYLPLAIGLFYPVAVLPAFLLLKHPPVYLLAAGWGALWASLGVRLLLPAGRPPAASTGPGCCCPPR